MESELKQVFKNEIKNNRIQKKENKTIMNLFLNNIKDRKIDVIQKRKPPNIPTVPAFVNKLPDAINNMIFHYVGYRSKIATRVTIEYINHYSTFNCIRLKQMKIASYIANMHFRMENIRSMEKRREALLEMPCWVQRYVLGSWFRYLFPRDRQEYFRENLKLQEGLERKYKIKEGCLIRDFTQYSKDYVDAYRLIKDEYNENDQCDFI